MAITMEMPDEMSKVIHDFIRPTEWFMTTETNYDGTKNKYFDNEKECDDYYEELVDKFDLDEDVCEVTISYGNFVNGKKEVLINDWTKRDSCECCGDEITICYDNCSHPDTARECNQCEKHFCFDCAEWVNNATRCVCVNCK